MTSEPSGSLSRGWSLPVSPEGPGCLVHSGRPGGEGRRFPLADSESGRAGRGRVREQGRQHALAFPTSCGLTFSPGMGAYADPKEERVGDACGGHRFTWKRACSLCLEARAAPALWPWPPPLFKLLLTASPPQRAPSAQPGAGGQQGPPREALREELD